ncbi:MAG: DNA polymerase I [Acidimicrobiia bacterium]|nr:DNA polymerase I [Acidimicrobiia bacterium]
MPTLMLIDGNSLTYRAFHALPQDLATASGQVTNAVFGFTSMLINLVRDHQPDGVAVAFDRPEPTFRHEHVETYKANRSAAPDILKQQMGLVREVLDALKLRQLEKAGVEADDILATLATRAAAENIDVLLVTGDRDSFQLVEDPHIKVVYNKRGVSDYAIYDEAGILERTGVPPTKYVQYAALRGDNSDNLPGVPGVGEKTAAKLLTKYGDVDGIFGHVDEQTPKLRENLAGSVDLVRVNAFVMELRRDVDLDVEPGELLGIEAYDREEVRKLFDFLEFRTLLGRLEEAFSSSPVAVARATLATAITSPPADDIDEVVAAVDALINQAGPVSVAAVLPDGSDQWTLGGLALAAAVADDAGHTSVPVLWLDGTTAVEDAVLDRLRVLFSDDGPGIQAHDAKPLLRSLLQVDCLVPGLRLDTSLAAYLLDPAGNSYPYDQLLAGYTDFELPDDAGVPEGQLDFGDRTMTPAEEAALEAAAVAVLAPKLSAAVETHGLTRLNRDVEVPLVAVLAHMEHAGVAVDREELAALNDEMTAEAAALAAAIQDDAGETFNVNSTKKLREILFDKLELTPQKKTKTGYSTDQATLEKLSGEHPIIDHLLRYREVEKLRSTYGQPLLDAVAADGRIHATFNQTVARTGRLSSENPNLHNIPVRTELGRSFRQAFVAAEGYELLIADYNQIELRCIAHLADDPGLVEAFTKGDDIHNITAARVFDVEPDAVTIEQRSKAKMVSYGLAYGMEAYGLGQRLGIPTAEAREILDAYFEGFPSVKDYMEYTVTEARNRGFTETLFGRRRAIPELLSDNWNLRQAGERQAMNAGIQGLAADIFKVALVRLHRALTAGGFRSRLILQVHDEVILEVPPDERDKMAELVLDEMRGAFELRVPLEVNLAFGPTWAAAKG